MIVTVTLNPAVDRVVVLYELHLGDSNRVYDGQIDPGGKGVNVSRVLRELGETSLATGFVAGSLGSFVESSLKQAQIPSAFISIPGQTRQNLAIVETRWPRHTMLNEPGPETDVKFLKRLEQRLTPRIGAGDWVVLAGSLPPGIPATAYADLTGLVHRAGGKVGLDTDGEPLVEGILARPDLVKPNREELERLIGRPIVNEEQVVRAASLLREQGITYVAVSMGREGAIALGPGEAWRAVPPPVETVSAIGAGDSLVAGLVLALSRGESLAEGLRLGTAAGAATTLRPGTRLAVAQDIQRLLPLVSIQRLSLQMAA